MSMISTENSILVPPTNSTNNVTVLDVIGNKTDNENGDSIYAYVHTMNEHFHTSSKVYPTLAAGVTVTSGAGAWVLGAFAEIVPANTITEHFDIHFVNIGSTSANGTYELVLYAVTTEIARVRFTRLSSVGVAPLIPVLTPIIAANTQIQAKLASSGGGADSAVFAVSYHLY